MRTPAEYEAEIDRLAAALDLEAKARASMAEAAANAIEKLKARDAFLRQVMESLESGEAADDTVWFNSHTTLYEAIEWLLDDPKARGERPLLDDVA